VKQAYVSVVLSIGKLPTLNELEQLDAALAQTTRIHEIVVLVPFVGQLDEALLAASLDGPLTLVSTHSRATRDAVIIAGLGRAVGDFVVEWRGPIEGLDRVTLAELLALTDARIELIEVAAVEESIASRSFYRFANSLRPRDAPLRKTVARVYSRRALAQVLSATSFETQVGVLAA